MTSIAENKKFFTTAELKSMGYYGLTNYLPDAVDVAIERKKAAAR